MEPRLLFVVQSIDDLCPGCFFRETVDLLHRRGIELAVAVLDIARPKLQSQLGALAYPIKFFGNRFPWDIGVAIQIRQYAKSYGATTIHAWSERSFKLARAAVATSGLHLVGSKFDLRAPRHLNWITSPLLQGRSIQWVVTDSEIADRLRQLNNTIPIEVIEPGAPLPKFSDVSDRDPTRSELRETYQLPQDYFLIGAHAEMVPHNQLKDLLWATDLIQCVRSDFRFILFGHGPQKWRLQKFAVQCRASEKTIFADRFSDFLKWLPELDLYWHGYSHDPAPFALLAALRAGCPVLAARGASLDRWIRDEENGMFFDQGQRDQIARKTNALFNDPERLANMKRIASESENVGDLSTTVDQLIEVYRATCESSD